MNEYTISVSHAGFTIGIAIVQYVRNSLDPSRRADSSTASEMPDSINCFIRNIPSVAPQAGIITAQYESISPSVLIVIKLTMDATVVWNIRDIFTSRNIILPPGNLIFEIAYAASEPNTRLPNVPTTEISTVLNM